MPILSEIIRKYREEQEKRETYPIPCMVISPQNPLGDKPFMRIHVSGSLQVRCRGGEGWYPIIGRQYLRKREDAISRNVSSSLYTNYGKQKSVGWVDLLGLHSYCPFCRKFHLITHQEYDCAIFILDACAKEERERRKQIDAELAQGVKQTLGWQAARLAALGESLTQLEVPQVNDLGAMAYSNMIGAAFDGLNRNVSRYLSDLVQPALGNLFVPVTQAVASVELFKSTNEALFQSIARQGFEAHTRLAEVLAASTRPVEIFSARDTLSAMGAEEVHRNQAVVLSVVNSRLAEFGNQTVEVLKSPGLLAAAKAVSGISIGSLTSLAARVYRMANEYNAGQEAGEDTEDVEQTETGTGPGEATEQEPGEVKL